MPAISGGMALARPTGKLLRRGRQLLENFLFRDKAENHENLATIAKEGVGHTHKILNKGQNVVLREAEARLAEKGAETGWRAHTLTASLAGSAGRTLAAQIRRKAALQFASGRTPSIGRRVYPFRTPLVAFVGLGVVGGGCDNRAKGLEDLEGFGQICSRIKDLFRPVPPAVPTDQEDAGCRLDDYHFGPLIAKGCNSAVYSARLKGSEPHHEITDWTAAHKHPLNPPQPARLNTINEDAGDSESEDSSDSDFSVIGSQSSGSSDIVVLSSDAEDDVSFPSLTGSDVTILGGGEVEMGFDSEEEMEAESGCDSEDDVCSTPQYPLAIKMMFNYDAESNAGTILRTMESEAVPARISDVTTPRDNEVVGMWENGNRVKKKRLKPHENVVDMFGVFVDDVPQLPDGLSEYPDALPQRLNPDGYGRNKTMFIVMKRYGQTLREYLADHLPTERESTLLLSQLMEALLHLNHNNIAHRDLKSDNILLDVDVHHCPHLVVTDFGCCLADDNVGLRVPYVADDVTRGGNGSLMAPEISTAHPGRGRYLDYRKSDLWAAGTLAYEIFGGENPFYGGRNRRRLDSRNYHSKNLPRLPAHIHQYMNKIIRSMLRRKPSRRPEVKTMANALHLILWGPANWRFSLQEQGAAPTELEVMRWLLNFTAGVMCARAGQRAHGGSDPCHAEYMLQCRFLARLNFTEVMEAVRYLWSTN